MDVDFLEQLRANVLQFTREAATSFGEGSRVLDIAPQVHHGVRPFVAPGVVVETLDIDPLSGATYVADLCGPIPAIPDETFDHVVCTEVLEHTLQPFDAVNQIWRVLKPGGLAHVTTPFNFRIHGPLPDCWRFTEHGLRALFRHFVEVDIRALEDPSRPLMPIHYTTVARRPV